MDKILKIKIFYFILGAVIFSTVSVFAYSIIASNVGFTPKASNWNVDNVSDALDYLKGEYQMIEDKIGNHVEVGSINISFTHSWKYITITFEKPFMEIPKIRYEYNAGTSGGSVYVTNITTTSFDIGYNSFFSVLHSDTINWIAYGK
ncbi:MAG: H-type lectin domain-containing protein [Bacilli bacterium]|nr:H-type lectin domain-containing protein [Bacilli bacterium]